MGLTGQARLPCGGLSKKSKRLQFSGGVLVYPWYLVFGVTVFSSSFFPKINQIIKINQKSSKIFQNLPKSSKITSGRLRFWKIYKSIRVIF